METVITCPVCLAIPEQEIYQCTNGHIVCGVCVLNLKNCPQCRIAYGKTRIRVRVLEEVLENQLFECIYKDKGCSQKRKRSKASSHAKSCSYNPENLPLCQLLNFNECKYRANSRKDIISHFVDSHCATYEFGDLFKIFHVNFNQIRIDTSRRYWSPVILSIDDNPTSPLFIGLGQLDAQQGVSWVCVQIWGREEDKCSYKLELSLEENSSLEQTNRLYKHVTSVNREMKKWKSHNGKHLKKTDTITYPFSFIMENFLFPDGSLVVTMKFSQNPTNSDKVPAKNVSIQELCVFIQPVVEDPELKETTQKLQRLGIIQRQLLLKQNKEQDKLSEKIGLLELQQSKIYRSIQESQKKIDREHLQLKQSLEKELEIKRQSCERYIQSLEEVWIQKEKQMLHRQMLEREAFEDDKFHTMLYRDNFRKEYEEDALMQHKTINEKYASEKLALEEAMVTKEKNVNIMRNNGTHGRQLLTILTDSSFQ